MLNLFLKDHPTPDFLKMDVEGEEGAVLDAAGDLLHNLEAARSVLGTLQRFGYGVTLLDGRPAKVPEEVLAGEFHIMARP